MIPSQNKRRELQMRIQFLGIRFGHGLHQALPRQLFRCRKVLKSRAPVRIGTGLGGHRKELGIFLGISHQSDLYDS